MDKKQLKLDRPSVYKKRATPSVSVKRDAMDMLAEERLLEEEAENTDLELAGFDAYAKKNQSNKKSSQVLNILDSLDISNMKQKREQQRSEGTIPAFDPLESEPEEMPELLDPEEPGIEPEEAMRRRVLILEADPAKLKAIEEKYQGEGKENPLNLPLNLLKKQRMKGRRAPESVVEPTNITGEL